MNWKSIASLVIDPMNIPPEVDVKASVPNNQGRPSLSGPGRLANVSLNPYRAGRRVQELVFDLATALTREYAAQPSCTVPPQVLFPQVARIVERYLRERVKPVSPADVRDVFLSPYYGWVIERLAEAIRPDTSQGEAPEVPRYESTRGPGSTADIDFFTSRDVREAVHCHVNRIVLDTQRWEQSAAYYLDRHPRVSASSENAGLGFAIPYLYNGQPHDYVPDFLVRLATDPEVHLILEVKGYDPLEEVKRLAAEALGCGRQCGRHVR